VKPSGDLDADLTLNAYVRGVVFKVAPEYREEPWVYTDRPIFNAPWTAQRLCVEAPPGPLLRRRVRTSWPSSSAMRSATLPANYRWNAMGGEDHRHQR
jgi:hypothetical protein